MVKSGIGNNNNLYIMSYTREICDDKNQHDWQKYILRRYYYLGRYMER